MKRALGLSCIIIISLAVIGCGYPMGQTHDDVTRADVDDFWTVPKRVYYTLGDSFVRTKDLHAFASAQGLVETIPTDSVEISIVRNPDAEEPDDPIKVVNGQYRLVSSVVGTGSKLVIVAYAGKTDEYWIEIRNPDGTIEPDDMDIGEGSGIGIIWKE